MALCADGFYTLRFVLLARSIARLTDLVSGLTLSYFPTAGAAGAFAIGAERQRSWVDEALCRIHPG